MSAILRASGINFEVDAFLRNSSFKPTAVFRAGEPRFPSSQPNGRKCETSGINVVASPADFEDFKAQLEDAFNFLEENTDELMRLRDFKGVEGICLDFGANIYPPGWCSFKFPYRLLLIAGKLRVDLDLSVYPSRSTEGSQ